MLLGNILGIWMSDLFHKWRLGWHFLHHLSFFPLKCALFTILNGLTAYKCNRMHVWAHACSNLPFWVHLRLWMHVNLTLSTLCPCFGHVIGNLFTKMVEMAYLSMRTRWLVSLQMVLLSPHHHNSTKYKIWFIWLWKLCKAVVTASI